MTTADRKVVPVSDRANAGWTLDQMHRDEVYCLYDFVRFRIRDCGDWSKVGYQYFGGIPPGH